MLQRNTSSHLYGFTDLKSLNERGPLVISYGKGIYVYDTKGNKYLDGNSGLWNQCAGFDHPGLIEVAKKQYEKFPGYHSLFGRLSEETLKLSDKLIEVSPFDQGRVFFCNSGSEANDTAIKIVWYYHASLGNPHKRKIISRKGSYHGVTLAAASLTALDYAQKGFGLPLDFAIHTTWPHYFQNSNENESEEDFCNRLVSDLEKLIENEGAENIGAFIAEPLMGAGGVIIPPKNYFALVQPVLKKNNILFIADEVICGFGRTGNMWGSQTFDIEPDIITCAKGLSSAYAPISAVLMSENIAFEVEKQAIKLGQFGHGYTYSGHPVSSAVALKTLEIMEKRNIIDHVKKVSTIFSKRISRLQKYECIGNVRSIGLIGAAEFVKPGTKREKIDIAHKFAATAVKKIHESGVILRALPIDAIAFCPPLIITEDEINQMFDKIESVFPEMDQIAKAYN